MGKWKFKKTIFKENEILNIYNCTIIDRSLNGKLKYNDHETKIISAPIKEGDQKMLLSFEVDGDNYTIKVSNALYNSEMELSIRQQRYEYQWYKMKRIN